MPKFVGNKFGDSLDVRLDFPNHCYPGLIIPV